MSFGCSVRIRDWLYYFPFCCGFVIFNGFCICGLCVLISCCISPFCLQFHQFFRIGCIPTSCFVDQELLPHWPVLRRPPVLYCLELFACLRVCVYVCFKMVFFYERCGVFRDIPTVSWLRRLVGIQRVDIYGCHFVHAAIMRCRYFYAICVLLCLIFSWIFRHASVI